MAQVPYRRIPPMAIVQTLSPVPAEQIGMGLTAENLQEMYGISRAASDEFADNSQMRAKAAWENEYFKDEIIPATLPATRKTPAFVFDKDEHLRPDTTMAGFAKLKPAFKDGGTVTAGNASGLNDGSAFLLMMAAEKAEGLGYETMARWVCGADCGVDPKIMGIGPAFTIVDALRRAGLNLDDMDVMECNEAFAVQNLAVIKEVEKQTGRKVDMDKSYIDDGGGKRNGDEIPQ